MTFSKVVALSLLVTIFAGMGGAIPNPASGGSSVQELGDELADTIRSLPKDLSSEEQRERFAKRLELILDARIKANVNGYEQDEEFKRRSAETLLEAVEALKRQVPELKEDDVRSLAETMAGAYRENEDKFNSFYERALGPDSGLSKKEVRDTIVQLSAILYVSDRELWEESRRFTFVFPFCRKEG